MAESNQLLAEYAKTGSEAAFRELVTRYVDLVYSAAIRLVNNDGHLAQDVTQTVFTDFARAARNLSPKVMIGGWLHRHTCFVARKTMRGEKRRRNREQQAALMNSADDKLNDLLADDIMENVDHLSAILRDGRTAEEADQIFAAQEAALMAKVQALLGPEAFTQYKDYTQNLLGHLTTQQFKAMVKADGAISDEQIQQLYHAVQEESQLTIANAGLRADFQLVPILNFRNLASEQEAERSVQRLDEIYARVAARGQSFLDPATLQKFQEFRALGVSNSRTALAMNRKMMAPPSR